MISPTGKGVRIDSEGDGRLGTSRGGRRHRGVDYECEPGQGIVAPFDMRIDRVSNPSTDGDMTGVAWSSGRSEGRMWYFIPDSAVIGAEVKEGDVIGIAQDVSAHYKLPNMIPHIHFQVNK